MIQRRTNVRHRVLPTVLLVGAGVSCLTGCGPVEEARKQDAQTAAATEVRHDAANESPIFTVKSEEGLLHRVRVLKVEEHQVTLLWNIENGTDKDVFVDGDCRLDWHYETPSLYYFGVYDDSPRGLSAFRFAFLRPKAAYKERRPYEMEESDVSARPVIAFKEVQPEKGGKFVCTLRTVMLTWDESAKRMVYKDVSAEVAIPFEGDEGQNPNRPEESPSTP